VLKADVEQLRLEKQTAFETQTEEWRNSDFRQYSPKGYLARFGKALTLSALFIAHM
jgi:hypothetical protein